ncbi:hypothetical protein CF326_g5108 [Tilletia indica]|nr:hypothetical protein CF326_g5108 [Tilletia indica]
MNVRTLALLLGTLCAIGTVSASRFNDIEDACQNVARHCQSTDRQVRGDALYTCMCQAWVQLDHKGCQYGCYRALLPDIGDKHNVLYQCKAMCNGKQTCDPMPAGC